MYKIIRLFRILFENLFINYKKYDKDFKLETNDTLVSFNIRADHPRDNKNNWVHRRNAIIEFIKNPQVEFEKSMFLDMGQWLSLPFIVGGVWILNKARKNKLPNIFTWVNPVRPKDKSKK
jgi:hypothetical protein